MKRILVLAGLFLCAVTGFSQVGSIQDHCYLGGTKATTQGLPSANYLNGIIPGCTVTVYLHGVTPPTKAVITSDGSTPLSNPFTANVVPGVDPGGWLFFAPTNAGLDIVMSGGNSNPACNTAPLCYTTPVTLVDKFPSASFLPGTGVTSINGVQGAFSFTGNVVCTGTSCNFGNGTTFQHNAVNLPTQTLLNFLDTPVSLNPAALDPNNQPVVFKNDSHGGLAAETLATSTQFTPYFIPPISGQFVNLCSGTQAGSGSDSSQIFTTSPCAGAVTAIGGPIGAPHSSSITWSNYSLPSFVNPANVSAVYAEIIMKAENSGIGSWTFVCSAQGVGTTSVTATRQFSTLLSGVTGGNIGSVSCTVAAAHSGGNAGTFTYVSATVELFAFYTGTPPPAVNQVNIAPCLNWDSSVQVLSGDLPCDVGTDSGTANNYLVTLGASPLAIPGLTVKFLPGNNSTSTTPTLTVNGVYSGTIVGPRGGALASGDISNTVVAEVILESNGSSAVWSLQNPQAGGAALPNALTMNNSGSGAASGTTYDGSAARTISWNTIGAAPSVSPVLTGTPDASGASQFKLPVAAGYAPLANGECGYDTTNNNFHCWINGADNIMVPFPASSPPSNGNCAQWVVSASHYSLGQASSGCASAASVTDGAGTTTPNQMAVSTGVAHVQAYKDFPEHLIIPAANCNNATAGAGWSIPASNAPTVACRAGSNNLGGVLQWANNNTTTNAQFTIQLPFDWDTSVQPWINIIYGSGANTSGTVKWTFSSACTKSDGSVTDDPSFNAESATTGKTMATANRMWAESVQFTAVTSGNNCVQGSTMIVKVTSGNGSATSSVNVEQVTITVPRQIVDQAN